jgi:hypothetical protein
MPASGAPRRPRVATGCGGGPGRTGIWRRSEPSFATRRSSASMCACSDTTGGWSRMEPDVAKPRASGAAGTGLPHRVEAPTRAPLRFRGPRAGGAATSQSLSETADWGFSQQAPGDGAGVSRGRCRSHGDGAGVSLPPRRAARTESRDRCRSRPGTRSTPRPARTGAHGSRQAHSSQSEGVAGRSCYLTRCACPRSGTGLSHGVEAPTRASPLPRATRVGPPLCKNAEIRRSATFLGRRRGAAPRERTADAVAVATMATGQARGLPL